MTDFLIFAAIVAGVAILGLGIGMLVAPRLERLTEPDDEDEGAGDD